MAYIDEEGTFRAKLVDKEWVQGKNGEQLKYTVEVTAEGSQCGKQATEYMHFTDAAYPISEKQLRAMGWQGVDLSDLSTMGSVEFDIVMKPETYNGNTRMRIKFINALGEAAAHTAKPLDAAAIKAFALRMRSKIVGLDPKRAAQQPKTQPKREEPPPPDDSDIPNF